MAVDPTNIDLTKYHGNDDLQTLLLAIIAYCLVNNLAAGAARTNLLTTIGALVNTIKPAT